MPNLTQKQEAFCLAYIETGNASEAYRRSYDAERMKPATVNRKAKELIDNGKIAARLAGLRNTLEDRAIVSREWIIDRLVENAERAMQNEAVMVNGVKTGEYVYQGSVANRALELLGKEFGMFVDRHEVNSNVQVLSGEPLNRDEWAERYTDLGAAARTSSSTH